MAEPLSKEVAALKVIRLSRLVEGSSQEQSALLDACINDGFFYLDFSDTDNACVLQFTQDVFQLAKSYFDQDLSEKMNFDVLKMGLSETFGYKPLGTHAGIIEGQRDGFESFKVPSNHVLELDRLPVVPPFMEQKEALLRKFTLECGLICRIILESLSTSLGRSAENRFGNCHRHEEISNSSMVMTKYMQSSAQTLNLGHNAHTDIGTLTVLFSSQWGLQVFEGQKKTWSFVAPVPNHAIINVGDSLRFLSSFVLQSSLHRVVPHPGDKQSRYSVAYFLRPEKNTMMLTSEGVQCSAQEWHERKFLNFMESHQKQRATSIQTGGMGEVTLWEREG